jgi:thiosulfate reductase cytochrome b subunit
VIAWLLASFIVLHIYLSTTGHSVLGSIQAMVDGWEMVEIHHSDDYGQTEGGIQ